MDFIRRVLGLGGEKPKATAPVLFDNSIRQDSRAPQTVLASLDIDAAINAHERWKARLMDYLEGRSTEKMDPDVIRQDHRSALGSWLHGVGVATLGHQPAFPLLMARHQYFHEQAANMIRRCRCSMVATATAPARLCCCSKNSSVVCRKIKRRTNLSSDHCHHALR